jgi:ketosteroid isomerase-like protein
MSQEKVEILRRMYEAASRGDWESAFRDVHPDCEATFMAGFTAGTYQGREEIEAGLSDVRSFDVWISEPLEFFESGDQIVVIVRNRLRPKGGTGGEFEYRNGQIWTFRDGTIVSLVQYATPEETLEAMGLSEQDAHADS